MKINRETIIPHLKQESDIFLSETEGNVYDISSFVKNAWSILCNNEQKIINKQLDLFSKYIPNILKKPLIIKDNFNKENFNIKAKSVWSRSAFLVNKKLKFKGCRIKQDLYFPHEQLNFGDTKMTTTKIMFGAMSAENVMREVLAFCFLKTKKISVFQKPIVVFEYFDKNKIAGYCLVFESQCEKRIEQKENFLNLTIDELIKISFIQNKKQVKLIKNQVWFDGIEESWYNEKKSNLLVKMNFYWGFRWVLNSNIGNDIVYKNNFYICDFDTFKVINIPKNPTKKFVIDFILWCIVEVLKTSPFILDYIDIENVDKKQYTLKIWDIYIKKSTFWKFYYKILLEQGENNGWDKKIIEYAIDKALTTEVVSDLILDNVLNSKVIKNTYKPELSFYTPQGYN